MRYLSVVLAPLLLAVFIPDLERPRTAAAQIASLFEGRTESRGELHRMFSKMHIMTSSSIGRIEPDGTLVLDQIVEETDTAPVKRVWRLRENRPGHCTGTVSDGVGPVQGEFTANQLHLTFELKGGLMVEQWLTLGPDGRSASNRLKIRKFGMQVATLDAVIKKVD